MEQYPIHVMLAIISNNHGFRIVIWPQRSTIVFLQQVFFLYISNFVVYSGMKRRIMIGIAIIIYRKVVNLVLGIII